MAKLWLSSWTLVFITFCIENIKKEPIVDNEMIQPYNMKVAINHASNNISFFFFFFFFSFNVSKSRQKSKANIKLSRFLWSKESCHVIHSIDEKVRSVYRCFKSNLVRILYDPWPMKYNYLSNSNAIVKKEKKNQNKILFYFTCFHF